MHTFDVNFDVPLYEKMKGNITLRDSTIGWVAEGALERRKNIQPISIPKVMSNIEIL